MHPADRGFVATHDVIVIGASAGGVEAISTLVTLLPRDLHAAVLVVIHLSRARSVFPEILNRLGGLPAVHPVDGEPLKYGRIYVAPPDRHLIVVRDSVRLLHAPTENGVRPAVDPLFRSAARTYGSRVIGVILTGALDDGTAGLAAVKEAGGVAVIQDPAEAFAPGMPRSALEHVAVDYVLPLREIPTLLTTLTKESARHTLRAGPHLEAMEPDAAEESVAVYPEDRPGQPSVLTCPECHGTLWEVDQEGLLRFRCRVGHVYSIDSMLAAQTDAVDRALWAALKSLEERAALTRKLSRRARARGQNAVAEAFEQRATVAEGHANVVRQLLVSRVGPHGAPDEGELDAAAAEALHGPSDHDE